MQPWQVYILQCSDGSLYTGIARDPARRLRQPELGPLVLALAERLKA